MTAAAAAKLADLKGLQKLNLSRLAIDDAVLSAFKDHAALRELRLDYIDTITDAGIASLGSLPALADLSMNDTLITGQGFTELARAKNLMRLSVVRARLDDANAQSLGTLTTLQELYLTGNTVGDPTASEIAKLTLLNSLYIAQTAIGDAGFASISGLTELKNLQASRTPVTDQGVAAIDLPSLEWISLDETAVTDATLEKLAARDGLRVVNVRKTVVTKELVEKVVEARKEASVKLSVYN